MIACKVFGNFENIKDVPAGSKILIVEDLGDGCRNLISDVRQIATVQTKKWHVEHHGAVSSKQGCIAYEKPDTLVLVLQ